MLKELLLTLLVTITFLNSVLMMEKLLKMSRFLAGTGITLADMTKLILYLQPQLLLLTLPMSLLLSTLLVYGRMNQDNELTVLRVLGMDFKRISLPVLVLGAFCFLASILVSFSIGPKSSMKLREEIRKIIAIRSTLAIEEGTFNATFKDIVIMVQDKKSPDTLDRIFIYDYRDKGEPKVLMAREGTLFMQDEYTVGLHLREGYMNLIKGTTVTELFFDSYRFTLNLYSQAPAPKKTEFTPFELIRKAHDTEKFREKTALYLEFHRRLSLPSICLLLIFLGPPLSLMAGKSGRLGGLALGLLVFTLYYILLIQSENLVKAETLPHFIGAWIPLFILGMFAFVLFRRRHSQ